MAGYRGRSSRTGKNVKRAVVKKASQGRFVARSGGELYEITVEQGGTKGSLVHESGNAKPDFNKVTKDDLLASLLGIPARANAVAEALGSKAKLAQVLKVSASQPTRWIRGEESPNSENTRAIVDLEHVVTRARLLWGDDATVSSWLNGRNAFLDGARPIDVVALQGSGPVIDALDQETAGVFA